MNIRISNNLLKLAAVNPSAVTSTPAIPKKTTAPSPISSVTAPPATLAMSQGASGGYTPPATKAPAATVDYSKPYTPVNPYAAQYKSQFPKGDEQYAPGSGTAMSPEQMRVRNLYRLNEANIANPGSIPAAALDGGDGEVQKQQQAQSDWMANRNLATLKQMRSEGKFVPDAALETGPDANYMAQMNATNPGYGSYLADSLKRVGNRYGGGFELEHPNDELLDYSSYALEAAPQLLMAAGTGGGSTAPGILGGASRIVPTATRAVTSRVAPLATQALSKVPGATGLAQFATKGISPNLVSNVATGIAESPVGSAVMSRVAPFASQLAARVPGAGNLGRFLSPQGKFVGNAVTTLGNSAMSAFNPVPVLSRTFGAGGMASTPIKNIVAQKMIGAPILQNAISNVQGVAGDVSSYAADNPDAGFIDQLGQGAQSAASRVAVDPTVLTNRLGVGASTALPVLAASARGFGLDPSFLTSGQTGKAINTATNFGPGSLLGAKGWDNRVYENTNDVFRGDFAGDDNTRNDLYSQVTQGNVENVKGLPWADVAGGDRNKLQELGVSWALAPNALDTLMQPDANGRRDPRAAQLAQSISDLRSYNPNDPASLEQSRLAQDNIMGIMKSMPELTPYFAQADDSQQAAAEQPQGAPQG